MRILTFGSLFPTNKDPNYGVFIYQRSAHLARHPRNEVVVVSPAPYFPRWLKTGKWRGATCAAEQENFRGLTVYHPRYFLLPKVSMLFHGLLIFLGTARLVKKLHRENKIDCIDAHFIYPDGLAAVLLGKMLDVPVTVSARGTDINLYPSFRLIRPMIRWTLTKADGIIAVSAALKETMIGLGLSPSKIRVIPNGIDTARFQQIDQETARKELNLPGDARWIVSVGALIPAKGHDKLIRAFARIAPRHPNLRLYILGEGPSRRELESLIREVGLQEKIQLAGKRPNEELQMWFNAAEMSCLASSREGWPNVVTESLACGTPVVATRVGGIPEIIQSEELGVLVDSTVESIAGGLEQALSKKWDRETISKKTRARTWEQVAAEVEEVLAGTLPKEGRG